MDLKDEIKIGLQLADSYEPFFEKIFQLPKMRVAECEASPQSYEKGESVKGAGSNPVTHHNLTKQTSRN